MGKTLRYTKEELAEVYSRHVTTVYRVCLAYLRNVHDTEDAVHDTFMRLISSNKAFSSEEHEKAWLIRVATNVCKDALKHWSRRVVNLDDYPSVEAPAPATDDTFEAIFTLPDKYKTVVTLYYFDGFSSAEIAKMLRRPQSTVTNYLSEARKVLRKKLGGEYDA